MPRLKNYLKIDTEKIDVSDISAKQTAEIIYKSIIDEEQKIIRCVVGTTNNITVPVAPKENS